jgi:predicted esterase
MAKPTEQRLVVEFPCYYDLYLPEGEAPKPLIIGMHGYGGDKSSMMNLMRRINEQEYVLAALQGPHQHLVRPQHESASLGYGFGWLSNFKPEESIAIHHQLVRRLIEALSDSGKVDPRRVFLLGFSQSVGVNFRFAFTHPELIRGVTAICGGSPGDWEHDEKYRSGGVDVLYLGTEHDEVYPPDRLTQHAQAIGRRARSLELQFFNGGHQIPREAFPVINHWLSRKCME